MNTEETKEYYKGEIVRIVNNIEDEHWLRVIYAYVKRLGSQEFLNENNK